MFGNRPTGIDTGRLQSVSVRGTGAADTSDPQGYGIDAKRIWTAHRRTWRNGEKLGGGAGADNKKNAFIFKEHTFLTQLYQLI